MSKFKFNIETIKGFARTTSANRVLAVQMICAGSDEQQCKENARQAYLGCVSDGVSGIDKGTLDIFNQLASLPLNVWSYFRGAGDESAEGEKIAGKLIKLVQANSICRQYNYDYSNGFNVGYDMGYKDSKRTYLKDSKATSEDGEDTSEDGVATGVATGKPRVEDTRKDGA